MSARRAHSSRWRKIESLSNEQRKRAVFWLAQSESAGAQAYLEKVLVGKVTD